MSAKNKNAILTNKNKDMFRTGIKGTVARDFWPLVFFMNRPPMGP